MLTVLTNLMVTKLLTCSLHMSWSEMKRKPVWIPYWLFWPKRNFIPAWDFNVTKVYPKRNEYAKTFWILRLMSMCVWKSLLSFWEKWHFISGDKTCKHYAKWNTNACSSKYRVFLKCSRNETSCEQNMFSRQVDSSESSESS